jgi:small GTP-binding protein
LLKTNLEKSKKFKQAFKKIIATGLSVLSLTPMTKSFVPSTLKAFNEVGENKNKKDNENNSNIEQNNQVSETKVKKENKNCVNSLKNKLKNLSAKEKISISGAAAVMLLGSIFLVNKIYFGDKKNDVPLFLEKNIIFIGDSKSGKTILLKRIFKLKELESDFGYSFYSKERVFNNQTIKFSILDLAGGEKFRNIIFPCINKADFTIIFIDSSRDVSEQLNTWLEIFKQNSNPGTKAMVILSRINLFEDTKEEIRSKKQIISQKINDFEFNERVTLFKKLISGKDSDNEDIQEFKNKMCKIVMSQLQSI